MSPIRPYHSKIANDEYRFHFPQAFLKTHSRLPDTLSTKQLLSRKKSDSPFLSFQLSAWKLIYALCHTGAGSPGEGEWTVCSGGEWRIQSGQHRERETAESLGVEVPTLQTHENRLWNMPVSISMWLVRLTRLNPRLRQLDFFHWVFAPRGSRMAACQPLWGKGSGRLSKVFVLLDFLAPDRFFWPQPRGCWLLHLCHTRLALSTRYALTSNDLDGLISAWLYFEMCGGGKIPVCLFVQFLLQVQD